MKAILSYLLLLLCPLMHVGMMLFMGRSCHGQRAEGHEETNPVSESGATRDSQ